MSTLDIERVVADAADRASGTDPDPDTFRPNLELLVGTINDEGRLHDHGVRATQAGLAGSLRKRIDISWWANEHPEITDEPIVQPLFLSGLPRSGTTYFQYLFDRDPAMRMLRTWEGDSPCPPPGFDPAGARDRLRAAADEANERAGGELHEAISKIHLTDHDGPQECVAILDQTFANPGNYWTHRIPSYFDRLLDTVDLRAAYAHHKVELQLLQWRSAPRRWVLKWPCHLVALDAVMSVYPDARFVLTHRDPLKVLASNCSLTNLLRSATSDHVDRHEIGRQMKDMLLAYTDRLASFDDAHRGDSTLVHVDYQRVVDSPDVVMAEVFEVLGMEMTAAVRESIVQWRLDNPPGKRGTHAYALDEYGLDSAVVAEEFGAYIERYDVAAEGDEP